MTIENISDTARWVAVYRAMETDRPDALFRDPFARRLAGERGEAIVRQMKRGRASAWAMIVRTAVFDEIILKTIERGRVDLVVNLAAGLDARPWRLPLPPALKWVDVDLPAILAYKTEMLRQERPVCRYEAVPADLTDAAARRALFGRLGAESANALVLSEGLLIYLAAEQVTELARDLHAQPSFRWWLIDLASPRLLKMMQRQWGKSLSRGNAPFRFAPAEGTGFFEPSGWRELEFRSTVEEAHRLRREMRSMWIWRLVGRFSARQREEGRKMSAYVLLERRDARAG
ncbi:MAG TPA: class I SAM-dependent methyltransferase [Gemmatimonadales bacterium]|nr:class I SAM-dependent methyltransferase [Gemmatimonadales bacterium]